MRNKVDSPKGLPSNCSPMGSFGSEANPQGRLNPQMPAKLQEIVNTSHRYICNGSLDFSPTLKAGAGVVADSKPEAEYEETLNKARGMLKALACLQ